MTEEITLEDFKKLDLRVAKVTECSKVEKSRNLLKIIVDIGGQEKQIISSISNYYEPEELVGKSIIVLNNLKKARFMGLESEGMLMAVEKGEFLSLLTTDRDSTPGLKVS